MSIEALSEIQSDLHVPEKVFVDAPSLDTKIPAAGRSDGNVLKQTGGSD